MKTYKIPEEILSQRNPQNLICYRKVIEILNISYEKLLELLELGELEMIKTGENIALFSVDSLVHHCNWYNIELDKNSIIFIKSTYELN